MDRQVGMIGLGIMGGAIARNLAERGWEVFGFDTDPVPHPRNLDLAQWWAEIVNVPCIAQGGSDIASVEAVAATGAEFVALSSAVFGGALSPAEAVRTANELLDRTAQRFEE